MADKRPAGFDVRETLERLSRRDIRPVALVAFAVGVLFHACVVFAVLGDGDGGSPGTGPAPVAETPVELRTPTPVPNRMDCAAIRGTDYRSDAERIWFIQNCTTG